MSTDELFMGAVGAPAPPPCDLTEPAARFAPLGGVAYPVVADRWERLVTMGRIDAPPARVWAALTGPEHVREWFAVCHGGWAGPGNESTLDFEDGEFFYCHTEVATPPSPGRPGTLRYLWRWVGVGPAAAVPWTLAPEPGGGTVVTVTEEATNPPSDWRSRNGMGWPGIVDQLAAYLRTGMNTRWPWRRMGPYLQIPLPILPFQAWEALTAPGAVKHWLQRSAGSLAVDDEVTLVMGDASGTARLKVTKSVDAGQEFPSYLPYLEFELRRPSWTAALGGRLWIEPAGLGGSLLQVFHHGWEGLTIAEPVTERKLLTGFWINAAARAQQLFQPQGPPAAPHGWSIGGGTAESPSSNGHVNGFGPARNGNGSAPPMNPAAVFGFVSRVTADLAGGVAGLLAAVGTRLNLFSALVTGPATSADLAERTGLAERMVREWLWGVHSAGYVEYDRTDQRFTLPGAHAAVLVPGASPFSLAAGTELLPPLAGMVDEVAEAFRTGQGIGPERYPDAFYAAMDRMSATWLDTQLVDQWLPAVPGLVRRLSGPARVAEVGSGRGRALIAMASRFPNAEFTGYDLYEPNVTQATAAAERAEVADRVRFACADALTALSGEVDLITMFDVLHDAPDPEALLAAAHRVLAPRRGVLLVLESRSAPDPADNTGPAATMLYGTSTLYCVPTALAEGGPALGTLGLSYEGLTALGSAAGFPVVTELPVYNPMNALYLLRAEADA